MVNISTRPRHGIACQWHEGITYPFEPDQSIRVETQAPGQHLLCVPGSFHPIVPQQWIVKMHGQVSIMSDDAFNATFRSHTIIDAG